MDEYFDICQQYGVVPFIELKEDNGIIDKMIKSIKTHRLNGKCVVSSSSLSLLQTYRNNGGTEYIHHIFSSVSSIDTLLELGNAGLAFDITNLDADITDKYVYNDYNPVTPKELVNMCHDLGLKVCFRAVETKSFAQKSISIGIDYMPSNSLWTKSQII